MTFQNPKLGLETSTTTFSSSRQKRLADFGLQTKYEEKKQDQENIRLLEIEKQQKARKDYETWKLTTLAKRRRLNEENVSEIDI